MSDQEDAVELWRLQGLFLFTNSTAELMHRIPNSESVNEASTALSRHIKDSHTRMPLPSTWQEEAQRTLHTS